MRYIKMKYVKLLVCLSMVFNIAVVSAGDGAPSISFCAVVADSQAPTVVRAQIDIPEGSTAEFVAVAYKNGKMVSFAHVPAKLELRVEFPTADANLVKVFLVNSWDEFVPIGNAMIYSL